jgi:transglutaminase-like putative cysteine protease
MPARRRLALALLGAAWLWPLGARSDDGIRPAFEAMEAAQLRGDAALASRLARALLERLFSLPAAEREALGPEAEVLLRRAYPLGLEAWSPAGTLEAFATAAESDPAGSPLLERLRSVARFYAGAASVHAHGGIEEAQRFWEPLGLLSRWWIIGPFDNERGGGFSAVYGPERERRPDPAALHDGKNRKVAWRRLPVDPVAGVVDLDALLYPDDQAVAYAWTAIECAEPGDALLHVGSDEGYRLWLNGELLASRDLHRELRFDQDIIACRLRRGWNTLLVKIAEEEGRWEFRVRLSGAGGGPLSGWREADPAPDAELPPAPAAGAGAPGSGAAADGTRLSTAPNLEALERRLQSRPDEAWDHYVLGLLLGEIRGHDVAEHPDQRAFERAIQILGEQAGASHHYHLAASSRRRRGAAADRDENAWRLAIEKAATGPEAALRAQLELSRYYLETFGNLAQAEAWVNRALEQDPRCLEARLVKSRVAAARGFPRAEEAARLAALAEGFESPALAAALARSQRDAGKLAEAIETLLAARKRDALDAGIQAETVALLLDAGRGGEALALLDAWIRIRPFDLDARRRRVEVLEGFGKPELALDAASQLAALAPSDPELRRLEGEWLWLRGRREEALAAWEQALEIQPALTDLRERIEFLRARRDPLVEAFRRDVDGLIDGALAVPPSGDDPIEMLLDLSAIEVRPDGTSKAFHQQVFRVLNEAGARANDRYSTYYAAGDQRVEFKIGRVLRAGGRVERARLGTFAGRADDGGEARSAAIDLPPLEKGDAVEVQYVVEDVRQSFFGDYFGHREYFRADVPVREKVFILRLPAARRFYFHQRNLEATPSVVEDAANQQRTYTWKLENVDKLKPEPGMPPAYEALPVLEASTFADWMEFSRWYALLIRKQFESSPMIRQKALELTSGKDSAIEKIRALYHFVAQEVRYNAWEFGVHGFKPYNASTIFARRFGDCKDKATLLTTMLAEVGIPSYPVLIRAADSRGAEDLSLPMVHHFNHCITYVPPGPAREELYLDGTALYSGLDELPGGDRGARVLVVRPAEAAGSLEDLPWNPPGDIAAHESIQVALAADLGAEIEVRLAARGDYASALRRIFEVPGQRRKQLERVYGPRLAGASIEEEEFSALEDLAVPVQLRVKLRVPKAIEKTPDGFALKPMDDLFATSRSLQGVNALEERSWDLLLGAPRKTVLDVDYRFPPGMASKSHPRSGKHEQRFGRLSFEVHPSAGGLRTVRTLELSAHRLGPAEYASFRELATALEKFQEEKIVLEAGRQP